MIASFLFDKKGRGKKSQMRIRKKQGRIYGNPCRGRLGRGSLELGRGINIHEILISALFKLQTAQKRKKSKMLQDRPTG